MALLPDEIYSPDVLSTIINVPVKTLERWRRRQTGPPCSKMPNGEIRYLGRDVLEWFEKRKLTGVEKGRARQT